MVAAHGSTDVGADVVSLDDLVERGSHACTRRPSSITRRLAKAKEAAARDDEEEKEEVASFYEEEDRGPASAAAALPKQDEECDVIEQQDRPQFPRSDESFFQERRADDGEPEERSRFPRSDESFFDEVRPSEQASRRNAEDERSPRSRPSVLASATSFVATGGFAEKDQEDPRPRPFAGELPSAKSFVVSLGKADAGAIVALDAVDELLSGIEQPDQGVPMDPNEFRMAAFRMAAAAAAARSPMSALSPASTPRRRRRTVGWEKEEEEDIMPRQTSTKMLPSGEVLELPSSPTASGEGAAPGEEAGEVREVDGFAREATAPLLLLDNVAAQEPEPNDGAIGSPGGGCVQVVVHKEAPRARPEPQRCDELALVEAPTFDFEALGITEDELRRGPLVALGPSALATKSDGGISGAPTKAIVAIDAVDSQTLKEEQLDLVAMPEALDDAGRGRGEEAGLKTVRAPAVGQGEHLGEAYLRHCNWNFVHIQSHGRPSGDAHYDMARCLSLGCGSSSEGEPSSAPGLPPCLPSATAEELLEARLDLATEMLRSAAIAGFTDAARAEADDDLAAVARRRPRQFATALRRMRGEPAEELAVVEDCAAAAAETAAEARRLLAESGGGSDVDEEDGSSSSSEGSETGEEDEDDEDSSGESGSSCSGSDCEGEDDACPKKKVSGEDDSDEEEDEEAEDTIFASWRAFSSSFKQTFGWSF